MDQELANSQRIIAECLRRTPVPADELKEYIAGIELMLIETSMKIQKLGTSFKLLADQINSTILQQQEIITHFDRITQIESLAEWKKNKKIYYSQNFFQKPPIAEDLLELLPIGPLLKPVPYYQMNTEYSSRMRKSFASKENQIIALGTFKNLNIDYEEERMKITQESSLSPPQRSYKQPSSQFTKKVTFRRTGKDLDERSFNVGIDPRAKLFQLIEDMDLGPRELMEDKIHAKDGRQIDEITSRFLDLEKKVLSIQQQNVLDPQHTKELLEMNSQLEYFEKFFRIRGTVGRRDLENSYIGIKKNLEALDQMKTARDHLGMHNLEINRWISILTKDFNHRLNWIRQMRNQIDEHIQKNWLRNLKHKQFVAWKNIISLSRQIKIGQIELIKMCWRSDLPKHQKRLNLLIGRFKNLYSTSEWIKSQFGVYWEGWNENRSDLKRILKVQ